MNMFMNTTLKLIPQPNQCSGIVLTILLDSFIRFWIDLLLSAIIMRTRKDMISDINTNSKKKFIYSGDRGYLTCFVTILVYIYTEYVYPDWEIYAALLVNMLSILLHNNYDIDTCISVCIAVVWPTSSVLVLKEYGIIALFMYRTGRYIIGKNIFMCMNQLAHIDIEKYDNRLSSSTAVDDNPESNDDKTFLDRVLIAYSKKNVK